MRFFRRNTKWNIQYIVGEILLIFLGISLAIWFNNWNSSRQIDKNKLSAIVKLKEEISNNRHELEVAHDLNKKVFDAYNAYKDLWGDDSNMVIATPDTFRKLQNEFGKFFAVEDSTRVDDNQFRYIGKTYITLEMPELSEIAWKTTQAVGVTNELGYNCLYELETMYNLQHVVQNQIDKAFNAMQNGEIKAFISILNSLDQLDGQLLDSYQNMIQLLDECG